MFDRLLTNIFSIASHQPHTFKIIGGDFNLPNITWDSTPVSGRHDKLVETLELYGWVQQVRQPTRRNNILDLLFTINIDSISVHIGQEFFKSDHRVILCIIHSFDAIQLNSKAGMMYKSRHFDQQTWKRTESLIRCLPWETYFTTNNIDIAISDLYHNLIHCLDCTAPIISHVAYNANRGHNNFKTFKRKLRKLKHRYHKHNNLYTLQSILKLIDKSASSKRKYFINIENKALGNKNPELSLLRLFKSRVKSNSLGMTKFFIVNGRIIDDPDIICEEFSQYFSQCYNARTESCINTFPMLTCRHLSKIDFVPSNIKQAITALKKSYDGGPDGIPSSFVKYGSREFPLFCLKLFNLSMEYGAYPSAWKTSLITPRFKTGSRSDIANYRPINLTSVLSRTMEKIVHKQLLSFLLSANLISPSQHGFMTKRSCFTSHLEFFDQITQRRDVGQSVIILYFDFSKAFDSVPHKLLLLKLSSYGIRNPLLSWLKSFLEERSQIVRFGSCYSKPVNVTSGVIQGSVIGPLLFLLFINDVCSLFQYGKPFLFADDLKVVYSFSSPTEESYISTVIQEEINRLYEWTISWNLPLNVDKSGFINIGRCLNLNLAIHKYTLKPLNTVRDLGLRYSDSLNFSEHIASQISKARKLIGFIMINFNNTESRLLLYRKCILPILEYGILVYSNCRHNDLIKIEGVQRRFTKAVLGYSDNKDYHQRCQQLKLEPLWIRRIKLNLIFLYRLLNGISYSSLSTPSYSMIPSHNLRNKENIIAIPKTQTNLRQNFFVIRYSTIWNRLPMNLRCSETIIRFRSLLDDFLSESGLCHLLNINVLNNDLYKNGPSSI
ncbi:unnamed protein product [Schistosoma rodhaini]|uniref:Reverse transcriptase domain-containing protein n=1 Tax=Schistosoma rodhaini TaxID=6188 RepID=A0AA85F386_9TREM|nr:unnamed protein product [Schistosoma rodhaini]CAH8472715.1 unnamed protein product [Schistosoma rodhaini]CAH8520798.1 unnamed protein product [Schistosoma rodhaini]